MSDTRSLRHFQLVREGVDVQPLLDELDRHPELWFSATGRREKIAVQSQAFAIPIRGLRKSAARGRRRRDVHPSRYTSLGKLLPQVSAFLEETATALQAELGRARLVNLPPGAEVLPHVDRGDYYLQRDRYHLAIHGNPQCTIRAGDEEVVMRAGELWWFDNKQPHAAANRGSTDRVHLIFDLLPESPACRRGPAPPPPPDVGAGLDALYAAAADTMAQHEAQMVQEACRLYRLGRTHGSDWGQLLYGDDDPDADERSPLRQLWRSLLGRRSGSGLGVYTRALTWALEEIDAGRVAPEDVARAIRSAGGVAAVARQWRDAQP